MGRFLARVPLDFDFTIDEPWGGGINPHPYADNCPHCNGSGLSPEAHAVDVCWYAHLSSEEQLPPGRAPKIPFTHPAVQAYSRWQVARDSYFYGESMQDAVNRNAKRLCNVCYNDSLRFRLTQQEITEMQRAGLFDQYFSRTVPKLRRRPRSKKRRIINKWRKDKRNWVPEEPLNNGKMHQPWELVQIKQPRITRDLLIKMLVWEGFSSVFNQYSFLKWWCKRAGITVKCQHCHGEGIEWSSEEAKKTYEEWEETPIPKGPGYQIWSNTGEDTPITPVFSTLEEVCEWAEKNQVSVFGNSTATKQQWMSQFSDKDFATHEVELDNGGTLVFL